MWKHCRWWFGLSDPQAGKITLDGHTLRDYSLAALRQTICYVPQKPVLVLWLCSPESVVRKATCIRLRSGSGCGSDAIQVRAGETTCRLGHPTWPAWPQAFRRGTATAGSHSGAASSGAGTGIGREHFSIGCAHRTIDTRVNSGSLLRFNSDRDNSSACLRSSNEANYCASARPDCSRRRAQLSIPALSAINVCTNPALRCRSINLIGNLDACWYCRLS